MLPAGPTGSAEARWPGGRGNHPGGRCCRSCARQGTHPNSPAAIHLSQIPALESDQDRLKLNTQLQFRMNRPKRIKPGPGQESVWDYPRPPRLEHVSDRIRVEFNSQLIADSQSAYRVLETSHPPTYYLPPADIQNDVLVPTLRRSMCEWKGQARYFNVIVDGRCATEAAWSYPAPVPAFAAIRHHVAFFAHAMDACFVGDDQVQPQAGDFYGGWITARIVGPFKGSAGTWGW